MQHKVLEDKCTWITSHINKIIVKAKVFAEMFAGIISERKQYCYRRMIVWEIGSSSTNASVDLAIALNTLLVR